MGILPPREKDGEIKFYVAKGLPYLVRMALFALLLGGGFALQVAVNFWIGYPLLVAAMILAANSGYDSTPVMGSTEKWEKVSPDEYQKVRQKAAALKKWDDDFFDMTSGTGIFCLLLVALTAGFGYILAAILWEFPEGTELYFGLDALTVIVPLWGIGTRSYLKKDKLVIKIDALERVMAELKADSGVQVQPMLSLRPAKGRGTVPEDARLMVSLVGGPKELYGVQVQVSINSVQGKDFPYLYCVVIAKRGSRLLENWEKHRPDEQTLSMVDTLFKFVSKHAPGDVIYEPRTADDVDIIVVRQQTTRQTGYFTSPAAARKVLLAAMAVARGAAAAAPRPA